MLEKVINKLLEVNQKLKNIDDLLADSPKDEAMLKQRQKLYHQKWLLEELMYD